MRLFFVTNIVGVVKRQRRRENSIGIAEYVTTKNTYDLRSSVTGLANYSVN